MKPKKLQYYNIYPNNSVVKTKRIYEIYNIMIFIHKTTMNVKT